MCGISGAFAFRKNKPDVRTVEKMKDQMISRGPDSHGTYIHENVVLGHRRLKIIDLSDASNQPIHDDGLKMTIVFNGCIYNYKELREELISHGYRFKTHGDTEVLLKAYHKWGDDFPKYLNGMFALAIYSEEDSSLFMARDRLGIKPFYYSENNDVFYFASSMDAILKSNPDRSIDPVALNCYMSFHSIVPAPNTIYQGVKKLPPATTLHLRRDGTKEQKTYWQLPNQGVDESLSFEEWKAQLHEQLRAAVRRRMVADVPVGVLLSGGLDSSLVVGLLHELGHEKIETFSIGFEDVNGEAGNEFQYSDIIAKHYNTKHHKIHIDSADALEPLQQCIANMSEPMVSHDNVGFYLLSKQVAKSLKVVQSGQGADEVFGGYHWYPPMENAQNPLDTYSKAFFDRDFNEYSEAIQSQYVQKDYAREFVSNYFDDMNNVDPVEKALRIDTNIMLVDDPVKRVDNNTMASSLEARVPFLDHELVEFAAKIPSRYKIKGDGKYILKEVGRDVIPSAVIDRPKGYFPMPALKYLRGDFLEMTRDCLFSDKAKQRGLFNASYLEKLFAAPEDHITPLRGSKLWQVAMLELWLLSKES